MSIKLAHCHQKLIHHFGLLGNNVGKHPLIFIVLIPVVSVVLSTGILRMNHNKNLDYLFASDTGKAALNKRIIDASYPINSSLHADLLRMTTRKYVTMIVAVPKDSGCIFREEIFHELHQIESIVQNVEVKLNDNYVNYSILCGKKNGKCIKNEIFSLKPYLKEISYGKYKVKYPFEVDTISYTVTTYIENLGGVTTDESGYVKNAKAARLIYLLDFSDPAKEEVLTEWEIELAKQLKQINLNNISISFLNWNNVEMEIKLMTDSLLPKSVLVLLIIAAFSMLTCMNRDLISSKPWLGICACISSLMALASSFGLMFYCGIDYTDINVAIPYLILGTEIDDAYMLIASWRRTDHNDNVEKRLSDTYSDIGVSIIITSLTNFLSFCFGTIAPFPVVRIFCIYAATSVLLCYIYQITFFGSFMALSGYREKQSRHPFTFQVIREFHCLKQADVARALNKFGQILCITQVKIFVLLIGAIALSVASFGIFHIKTGTKTTDVFNSNTMTNTYTGIHYKYFSQYPYPVQIIINQKLNYANESVQFSIDKMLESLENQSKIADSSLTVSWLKYFRIFLDNKFGKYLTRGYDVSNKTDFIDVLRNIFLKLPQVIDFKSDILFNKDNTDIISSRFIVICENLTSIEDEIELLQDLQNVVDQTDLSVIVYNLLFQIFEQAHIISAVTIRIVWLTTLLMIIVFFIFITDLKASICIAVIIFLTMCVVVGFMLLYHLRFRRWQRTPTTLMDEHTRRPYSDPSENSSWVWGKLRVSLLRDCIGQ
ncbi:patched domain-containing protein 3-like [Centruroides vittatus]|uniref:patched domain-containing protein 3-like n=1 Tax=Centruroides vittatus TaxID=120091 RepID=UPI00350FF503